MKKYLIATIFILITIFSALFFKNRGIKPEILESQTDESKQESSLDENMYPNHNNNEHQTNGFEQNITENSSETKPSPNINNNNTNVQKPNDERPAAGTESDTTAKPKKNNKIEQPSSPVTIPIPNNDIVLIEQIIRVAGFRHDREQNIFYSDADPWQKNFGFTSVYDAFAKFGAMIYETKRFKFSYGGHDWMFQVWKGRYGITSGAEIGIYYKDPSISGDFYNCADYDKYVAMDLKLYKDGKLYLYREPTLHWWLTGFRLGDITYANEFLMEFTFYLDNSSMANEVEKAVASEGFIKDDTYIRDGNNIRVFW